jgi:hypothetical protein
MIVSIWVNEEQVVTLNLGSDPFQVGDEITLFVDDAPLEFSEKIRNQSRAWRILNVWEQFNKRYDNITIKLISKGIYIDCEFEKDDGLTIEYHAEIVKVYEKPD